MKKPSIGDVTFVLGLSGLAYGLWVFRPWVSFVVIGAVVMWLGVAMLRKEGRGR